MQHCRDKMSWVDSGMDLVRSTDISTGKPWWQPLLSLVNFILLGYCMRTFFGWSRASSTKFRRFTFNVLLPIYVFRNIWVAHIDSSMAAIAKVSLFLHIFQALFWALLYRKVRDLQMRGWLQMVSQGCLTSFFYSNLGSHAVFGQQAVAICLLFDIGGNTPCAQGLLWGLGAFFAPAKDASGGSVDFRTAFSSPLIASSLSRSRMTDLEAPWERLANVQSNVKTGARLPFENFESDSLLGRSIEAQETSVDRSWLKLFRAVLYQPVLPAFLLGLSLSVSDVGCPSSVDIVLETVGLFFKPCLYFLIGLHSEFITDGEQMKIILTSLGLRYLFAGFMALTIWLWLPFGTLERTTMALSLLSPVSTMTMYLAAEYQYPQQYVAMSAALTTMSVFLSFVIQEVVMRLY